jgi:hypothetical protein
MRILGRVLLGLGAFLLMAAILCTAWAPDRVKKTPLDVNTTTDLEGEAAKVDLATGDFEKRPIYAVSVTKIDSEASTDDTAIWVNTSCAVFDVGQPRECVPGTDENLISAEIDTFATDRVSALAVESDKLPADSIPHEGLVNKFPFDSGKTTYPYWDGTVGAAVDAVYERTATVKGVETYVYKVTIEDAPIEIAEGVAGTYDDVKEIFVEPTTGAIVNQTDDQQRYLEDGTQVLDLQLAFTDDEQQASGDQAKSKALLIDLAVTIVPVVGYIGGPLCLLAGILLLMRSRPNTAEPGGRRRETVGAGA